jgi:hypothetical protein
MIDTMLADRERLDQLLADRCLFGLSRKGDSELKRLLPQFPATDAEQFERIAAAVHLALAADPSVPMPEHLRATVRERICLVAKPDG